MALTQKQGVIIGVGALAAVFLLKGRAAAAPKGIVKPAVPGAAGHPSGSLLQPSSTNLATGYGQRTTAQVPSIQGFGANVLAPLASIFGNVLKALGGNKAQPGQQQKSSSPTGGASGGSPSSGGATRPGVAPGSSAWLPDGTYVGKPTYSGDYDPTAFLGINPSTGLYDPNYDPSVTFNPESNTAPVDPSMLPGQTVIDENGQLYLDAPALGADGGDDPLTYFADTAVSPELPPLWTQPTVEPVDLGGVDPSMLPVDGTVDLALSDDSFGGGGPGWDDSADWIDAG